MGPSQSVGHRVYVWQVGPSCDVFLQLLNYDHANKLRLVTERGVPLSQVYLHSPCKLFSFGKTWYTYVTF